jgi:hypothetical protein
MHQLAEDRDFRAGTHPADAPRLPLSRQRPTSRPARHRDPDRRRARDRVRAHARHLPTRRARLSPLRRPPAPHPDPPRPACRPKAPRAPGSTRACSPEQTPNASPLGRARARCGNVLVTSPSACPSPFTSRVFVVVRVLAHEACNRECFPIAGQRWREQGLPGQRASPPPGGSRWPGRSRLGGSEDPRSRAALAGFGRRRRRARLRRRATRTSTSTKTSGHAHVRNRSGCKLDLN